MKNKIMFQVYFIYLVRKLKSPFIAESFLFSTLLVVFLFFVSIPSVIANMMASGSSYHYFLTAFFTTNLFVQALLISTGITLVFFLRNIAIHTTLKERVTAVLSFLYSPFLVK